MANRTVLIGEFKHETNTFSPTVTDRAAFQARWELHGEEIYRYFEGTRSPIGGFVDRSRELDLDIEYSIAANAMPGGPVTEEAYAYYSEEIVSAATALGERLDGIYLSLHGAMVPAGGSDGEGPLLAALRAAVGETPIVATLDPHTTLTDLMVQEADALIAYETYPHVDYAERGAQAADTLAALIDGSVSPVTEVERPPVLPDFPRMNTRDGPMETIASRARELESRDGVLKVNLIFGFNHADTPDTGMAVAAVTDDDPALATEVARDLSAFVWDRHQSLVDSYPPVADAVRYAKEYLASGDETDGPLLLIDVGDNPGGGGVEDRVDLLEALLSNDVEFDEGGIALVWDPASVARCIDAGVGETVSLSLGNYVDDPHFPHEPLETSGYIKKLTDGVIVNHGPKETGVQQNLGRTALVEIDGVDVIVSEHRYSPNDAEVWRHVGIKPERADLLVLKTVNHFRADYERFASEIVLVDSPGSFSINLDNLDYEHLSEPKYPLVPADEITYPDWD